VGFHQRHCGHIGYFVELELIIKGDNAFFTVDRWKAAEYYSEARRIRECKDGKENTSLGEVKRKNNRGF